VINGEEDRGKSPLVIKVFKGGVKRYGHLMSLYPIVICIWT